MKKKKKFLSNKTLLKNLSNSKTNMCNALINNTIRIKTTPIERVQEDLENANLGKKTVSKTCSAFTIQSTLLQIKRLNSELIKEIKKWNLTNPNEKQRKELMKTLDEKKEAFKYPFTGKEDWDSILPFQVYKKMEHILTAIPRTETFLQLFFQDTQDTQDKDFELVKD